MAHPPCFAVPGHKFGFALGWLEEFSTSRWQKYQDFISEYPPPASTARDAEEASQFRTLVSRMKDPVAKAAVRVGWELCRPAKRLLDDASKETRAVPMDYWESFARWSTMLQCAFENLDSFLATSAHLDELHLSETDRAHLGTCTNRAIASAFDKTYRHLAEDLGGKVLNDKGKMVALRGELEVYQRRACWNIGKPGTLPAPDGDDDAGKSWALRATGKPRTFPFHFAYTTFWERMTAGTLPVPVPPPPATPSTPQDNRALLEFWRAVAADADIALVGREALRARSIPISQTTVERSFSVLSNRESDNRLLAGDRYVTTMLMLSCNRPYVDQMVAERAAVLIPSA